MSAPNHSSYYGNSCDRHIYTSASREVVSIDTVPSPKQCPSESPSAMALSLGLLGSVERMNELQMESLAEGEEVGRGGAGEGESGFGMGVVLLATYFIASSIHDLSLLTDHPVAADSLPTTRKWLSPSSSSSFIGKRRSTNSTVSFSTTLARSTLNHPWRFRLLV
ncbi:hypothetical protein K466DRAFT_603133 [Polyporus arcularius HHB13444]|uniref:Uncharacterized protein n=1 Tax=Polyporus arcularius HHB13444 TaxID=1314778 RepID=A0A5C3P1D4_9APHY|nr:hypothetical protein K466DRAFT_603133 [Polyporus arcularius HHB13444]